MLSTGRAARRAHPGSSCVRRRGALRGREGMPPPPREPGPESRRARRSFFPPQLKKRHRNEEPLKRLFSKQSAAPKTSFQEKRLEVRGSGLVFWRRAREEEGLATRFAWRAPSGWSAVQGTAQGKTKRCQAEFCGAEKAQPDPSGLEGSLAEEGPCVKRCVEPRQGERLGCPTMYCEGVRPKRARTCVEARKSMA